MSDERLVGYTRIPTDSDTPRSNTIDQSPQFSWLLLSDLPDDEHMYYATDSNGIKKCRLPAKKLAPWFDEAKWLELKFGIVSPIISGDISSARAYTQTMATAKNLAELLAGMSDSREMKGLVAITRDMVVSSPYCFLLKPRINRPKDFYNMRQLVRFANKVTIVQTMAAGLISDINHFPLVVSRTTELTLALKPASAIPEDLLLLESTYDRKSCGSIDYAGFTGQVFLAEPADIVSHSAFLRGIPLPDMVSALRQNLIATYNQTGGKGDPQLQSEMMILGSLLQSRRQFCY